MSELSALREIGLVLLQVTGLMLPVVFLTAQFIERESESLSDATKEKMSTVLLYMIGSLTATGALSSIGLLETGIRDVFVFFGVLFLTAFFILYGTFIMLSVRD